MSINLDSLERLHTEATPGPWNWIPNLGPTAIYSHGAELGDFVADGVSPADTLLIVAARNNLPALIAELREARATIGRVRGVEAEMVNHVPPSSSAWFYMTRLSAALDGER